MYVERVGERVVWREGGGILDRGTFNEVFLSYIIENITDYVGYKNSGGLAIILLYEHSRK